MVSSSPALLQEAENFTLFIKNSISFPRFKVTRFVEKQGEMQVALGGHNLSPLSPCTHADFLLGQKLGWAPVCRGGGSCLQLQGLWEGRLWGLGGRGLPSSRAGWVPSHEYPPSWHAAATNAFLPTQAQPGGGGGRPLHEDLPLSQDLAPSVSCLQARLCGSGVRPEFQHLGREGMVPGAWGGLDRKSSGLIF